MNDAHRRARQAWDETNACGCPDEAPCRRCYGALLAAIDEIMGMDPMVTVKDLDRIDTAKAPRLSVLTLAVEAARDLKTVGRRTCPECKADTYDPWRGDACYTCRNKD